MIQASPPTPTCLRPARFLAENLHQLQANYPKSNRRGHKTSIEELLISHLRSRPLPPRRVPGLAKTLLVQHAPPGMDLSFPGPPQKEEKKHQFTTADLMPSTSPATDILPEDPDSGRRK